MNEEKVKIIGAHCAEGGDIDFADTMAGILSDVTTQFASAAPKEWRAILQISLAPQRDEEDAMVMEYADLQSVYGGGNWAAAKHKYLFSGGDYTRPMSMQEIREAIRNAGFGDDVTGIAICRPIYNRLEDLEGPDQEWLADTGNGPGIAPEYGGIKVPFSVTYRARGRFRSRKGWIMSSFAGTGKWDLLFACIMMHATRDYILADDRINSFNWDQRTLKKESTICAWLNIVEVLERGIL